MSHVWLEVFVLLLPGIILFHGMPTLCLKIVVAWALGGREASDTRDSGFHSSWPTPPTTKLNKEWDLMRIKSELSRLGYMVAQIFSVTKLAFILRLTGCVSQLLNIPRNTWWRNFTSFGLLRAHPLRCICLLSYCPVDGAIFYCAFCNYFFSDSFLSVNWLLFVP